MAEHEVPDLHDVEEKIRAAHQAEDKLLHTMPNAIHPDDDAYEGMTGPTEGDIERVDESARADGEGQPDDQRQAEAPEESPTQQVQDDLAGEDRDGQPEAPERS